MHRRLTGTTRSKFNLPDFPLVFVGGGDGVLFICLFYRRTFNITAKSLIPSGICHGFQSLRLGEPQSEEMTQLPIHTVSA